MFKKLRPTPPALSETTSHITPPKKFNEHVHSKVARVEDHDVLDEKWPGEGPSMPVYALRFPKLANNGSSSVTSSVQASDDTLESDPNDSETGTINWRSQEKYISGTSRFATMMSWEDLDLETKLFPRKRDIPFTPQASHQSNSTFSATHPQQDDNKPTDKTVSSLNEEDFQFAEDWALNELLALKLQGLFIEHANDDIPQAEDTISTSSNKHIALNALKMGCLGLGLVASSGGLGAVLGVKIVLSTASQLSGISAIIAGLTGGIQSGFALNFEKEEARYLKQGLTCTVDLQNSPQNTEVKTRCKDFLETAIPQNFQRQESPICKKVQKDLQALFDSLPRD